MKSRNGRVPKSLIIGAAVAAFVVAVVAMWWQDAPPIEDDYTLGDLRSAPPDCNGSYQLLLSIARQDRDSNEAPEIGLTTEDMNDLRELSGNSCDGNDINDSVALANAATIDRIWHHAEKGRKVFEKLDVFPEIADLTEPNFLQFPVNYHSNMRCIALVYNLKTRLLLAQGDYVRAIENSALINSVFRKYSLNARTLINKVVAAAGLAISIKLANDIANRSDVSLDSIELLAEEFQPLSPEVTSMRNPVIGEYLGFRWYILNGTELKGARGSPFCKVNSTLRLYRNSLVDALAKFEPENEYKDPNLRVCSFVWGGNIHLKLDDEIHWPRRYWLYNPMGSLFITIGLPATRCTCESSTKPHIQDDLLQFVLNKRLDRPANLKARAYSDEYIVDVDKRIIFSPGPDGVNYTDDDIKLKINPEVLNLTSTTQE
jgi:hypothetical protein